MRRDFFMYSFLKVVICSFNQIWSEPFMLLFTFQFLSAHNTLLYTSDLNQIKRANKLLSQLIAGKRNLNIIRNVTLLSDRAWLLFVQDINLLQGLLQNK